MLIGEIEMEEDEEKKSCMLDVLQCDVIYGRRGEMLQTA